MPTWGLPTERRQPKAGKGADMPEENTEQVESTQAAAEKTFTQAEMDAIIGERLNRLKAKYADYDELKTKATAYDEAAEASKSELQKAVERGDKLQAELDKLNAEREHAAAVAKAAAEYGVDADLLSRMNGDVDENARFLKEQMGQKKYPSVPDKGEVGAPSAKPPEIPTII